jgi:quinol-cytochrome oxidoreductase complex cytochrome b subunit
VELTVAYSIINKFNIGTGLIGPWIIPAEFGGFAPKQIGCEVP